VRAIAVIGSLNLDLVVMAPRLPGPGETVLGSGLRRFAGGKGANQAAAAARMLMGTGAPAVRLIGCVGRDEAGDFLRAAVRAAGVDDSGVRVVAEPTGAALITLGPGGENQITVAPGANQLTRPPDEELDLALCQLETPWLRPRARTLILNLAPAPAPPFDLRGVDWVIVNESEAFTLTGARDPGAAVRSLREQGAGRVLLTLGSRGVWEEGLRPAFAVRATDTVGAGDAFAGAFAAALASGEADPVRFAQAAAALKVQRPGAQNLPARSEVLALLSAIR
jgi:ribokinase